MPLQTLIEKITVRNFTYRSLPRFSGKKNFAYHSMPLYAGRMLGLGSYPKNVAIDGVSVPYYAQICHDEEYSGVYIVSGRGTYRDDSGNELRLEAGDFLHRLPGVKHSVRPDVDCKWLELFICLPVLIWESWLCCQPPHPELLQDKWHVGVRAEVIEEFIALQKKLNECDDSELCLVSLEIQNLLLKMYRISQESSEKKTDPIEIACKLLKEDFSRNLDLKALSEELGVGYETFRRKFLSQTGVTPGAYRNRQRIDKACTLLREHELSIAQIALYLGYSDAFVFSRQFKKATGKPPSLFARESI